MDAIDRKEREGKLWMKSVLKGNPNTEWSEVGLDLFKEWQPEEASSWELWEQEAFGEGMWDTLGKFLKEA